MNSNLYFTHETRPSCIARCSSKVIFNLTLRIVDRVTPQLATTISRIALSRPLRSARRGNVANDFTRQTLSTDSGDLQIYSHGEGPVVLFTHGWSGNASQFEPLMREISSKGFKAVAFDHYRHGQSGGSDSNYLLFISATMAVANFLHKQSEPVKAVVGHSVGGMASLHALAGNHVPHFLLSPVIGVYALFHECLLSAGMPQSMVDRVARSTDVDSFMSFASTDEAARLRDNKAAIKLVHSNMDRVVPSTRSLNLLRTQPWLNLDVGPFGGHSSILKKQHTKDQVSDWLCEHLN